MPSLRFSLTTVLRNAVPSQRIGVGMRGVNNAVAGVARLLAVAILGAIGLAAFNRAIDVLPDGAVLLSPEAQAGRNRGTRNFFGRTLNAAKRLKTEDRRIAQSHCRSNRSPDSIRLVMVLFLRACTRRCRLWCARGAATHGTPRPYFVMPTPGSAGIQMDNRHYTEAPTHHDRLHEPKATRCNDSRPSERAGVAFKLHEYDYDSRRQAKIGMQAAEALGIEPARLLKTLMVRAGKDVDLRAAAVRPRDEPGAPRRQRGREGTRQCCRAAAERISGYHVGGISPLGQKKDAARCLSSNRH